MKACFGAALLGGRAGGFGLVWTPLEVCATGVAWGGVGGTWEWGRVLLGAPTAGPCGASALGPVRAPGPWLPPLLEFLQTDLAVGVN